jgi:predicted TIM-barrel fold metal-dependent hydrolase
VRDLPLVDHHCHGIVRAPLDTAAFAGHLCEADRPGPFHPDLFDTQVGLAVRAICAPLLDLPRHAAAQDYLARRAELEPAELARRLLAPTGTADYLVDTGLRPEVMTSPAELAAFTGARGHEVLRLEHIAEQLIVAVDTAEFADAVTDAVHRQGESVVGTKSIAAYRGGLDLDPRRPSPAEVTAAAGNWLRSGAGRAPRLTDQVIIRHLLWAAIDLGKPLQFHVGYGDSDVDLHRCRPSLLTPLLRATAGLGVPVMLLHTYPYHREAGCLAQVFDHVFVDVGLALHNVGSRAGAVLAELLELAPFSAVLYSSDAYALPELYAIAAALVRRSLGAFLDDGIARDFWSAADADRIAELVCSENARRAYRLPG